MKNLDLTTEALRKKFQNPFDMTNFSIAIAREYVIANEGGSLNKVLVEIKRQIELGNHLK